MAQKMSFTQDDEDNVLCYATVDADHLRAVEGRRFTKSTADMRNRRMCALVTAFHGAHDKTPWPCRGRLL